MDGRTFETHFIRSTQRSRPKRLRPGLIVLHQTQPGHESGQFPTPRRSTQRDVLSQREPLRITVVPCLQIRCLTVVELNIQQWHQQLKMKHLQCIWHNTSTIPDESMNQGVDLLVHY